MGLRKRFSEHFRSVFLEAKDGETHANRINIIAFILLPVLVCWGLAAYVMFFSE